MRALVVGVVMVAATGLSAGAEPQRIQTNFVAHAYNSAANEYLPAATFLEIYPHKKGNDTLVIEVDDKYWNKTFNQYRSRFIRLEKRYSTEYIAAIDKYAQWADIATRDGDMITKEIGRVKARVGKHRFQMHSGNAANHYLVVELCPMFCDGDDLITLDYENAMALRETLVAFGAGELAVNANIDGKYQ